LKNKEQQIISLVEQAQNIGKELGYENILQPGFVKELIVATILDHQVHKTKHEPDAYDKGDSNIKYEYLSCFEKGSFQFDRMFKSPPDKRAKSLERISRNSKVYCAVFEKQSPLNVLEIYELEPEVVVKEAERQLDLSSNDISHVGLNIKWAINNGKRVYPNEQSV
jgi:hypothetical protein